MRSPVGSLPCVMLIHGLASSPLELQYLARNLRQAGYQVHLPTLPHYSLPTAANPAHPASATAGAMPQTAHLAESWLAQLQQQLQILHAQHGAVVVGGLCIGAVLALRLAQLQPAQVQGVLAYRQPCITTAGATRGSPHCCLWQGFCVLPKAGASVNNRPMA